MCSSGAQFADANTRLRLSLTNKRHTSGRTIAKMITTDFLVATAAQAAMNHAIVPSSVPPSHAVIAKAEEGDAAAIQAVLNHCKLARAEEDAADDVVRQLEKEAGHRLDAFSTIKVKEAFKMTLASRRISLTEITSPVFGKTTIVEPPRDPFRVVIIWRHSDDDSQKDFSESGLSLLEATWSLFAEDSKFRHASPTTGYLEVVSTFRIGSAIAGLTVKNGKEEHVLWEDLANDLRGAHRLIILGDDGFVTDRPSLAYLFSKTTADVVFGYTDTEASRAAYEIYTVEELLTSLQEHSSPVGRWWRSLNEGAAKRYLLSAAHNTRTLPQRHKFVEMAAESGWLAASGSQVKPSVNLPGIGQGRALTLKNRRKQLTFDVSKVLAAPPKSQEPRPRKRQKKAKHADKVKYFCPMMFDDCAQETEAQGQGQKQDESRIDYVARHQMTTHISEKCCPWTGNTLCKGLAKVRKTQESLVEHFQAHEAQESGVWDKDTSFDF